MTDTPRETADRLQRLCVSGVAFARRDKHDGKDRTTVFMRSGSAAGEVNPKFAYLFDHLLWEAPAALSDADPLGR